ncbi:MAG: histidine kinase [Ktedonobacteraceae bacterium]|nr:histidine kinase [Ktedonobacteraceae bacterium]
MPENLHLLLATLGGQPQVVTFTLDLLLESGYPISEVVVLHPAVSSQPRLHQALLRLNAEFSGNYYRARQRTIHFHSRVLERNGQPIDDIIDNDHADGALNTIHQLIVDLKRQGYHIHLSLSGGRRLMALLAIAVATLNFDRHDHIWHIYTPQWLQEQASEGKLMHAPQDSGVRLIEGQFITLGAFIPNAAQPFRAAEQEQRTQMSTQERARCRAVVKELTSARLKVLKAFARGLRPQQVAEKLCITLTTVNSHKTILLSHCRNTWGISSDEWLDYRFLREKFADYFENNEE